MPAALRAIPGAPPLLLGVLNPRGDMLPVIDLALRLGTPHGSGAGRVWDSRNRILRIAKRGRRLGVAVDLVVGIHQLQPDQRRKPVLGDGVADRCLGVLWRLVLELEKLDTGEPEQALNDALMRVFHTRKGTARGIDFEQEKRIAQRLEDVFHDLLDGAENRIDRAVRDPLRHMVRNALGHGIESTDERQRLGKAETGRLPDE